MNDKSILLNIKDIAFEYGEEKDEILHLSDFFKRSVRDANVGKRAGETLLFHNFSLKIYKKDTTTFMGRNGSGKSTLMRLMSLVRNNHNISRIASVEKNSYVLTPAKGSIAFFYEKKGITGSIGHIFQKYESTLLPWYNIQSNIALPLMLQGKKKPFRKKAVSSILKNLDIDLDTSRRIHEISGGQKQLVVLARSLVPNPEVVYADEPFSALDAVRSIELAKRVANYSDIHGISLIQITHDLSSCLVMSDRIVVLSDSKPCQVILDKRIPSSIPYNEERLHNNDVLKIKKEIIEALFK